MFSLYRWWKVDYGTRKGVWLMLNLLIEVTSEIFKVV